MRSLSHRRLAGGAVGDEIDMATIVVIQKGPL